MTPEKRLELELLQDEMDSSIHRLCKEKSNLHFYLSFAESGFINRIGLCLTHYWQSYLFMVVIVLIPSNLFARFSFDRLFSLIIILLIFFSISIVLQFRCLRNKELLLLIRRTKKTIHREERIYKGLFNKIDEVLTVAENTRSE